MAVLKSLDMILITILSSISGRQNLMVVGQQIGHHHVMVDKLLEAAEGNGITRSVVYSATKQWQKIIGFYEKHGFKKWFVQMYR